MKIQVTPASVSAASRALLSRATSTPASGSPRLPRGLGNLTSSMSLRSAATWSFSLAVAATVFSGQTALLGAPLPPDRLLFVLGFGLLVLGAPIVVRRQRGRLATMAERIEAVHILLAFTLLWAVGSALFAGSLLEPEGFFGLVDSLGVVPFALFLVAPVAFRGERGRRVLLVVLLATGAYLALTALFEAVGMDALVFPKYILDPTVGIHPERARGPFVEAVANGLALYGCGVAALVSLSVWRSTFLRVIAVAVALLCGLGIIFTLTRAIWLASVVASLVALAADRRLRHLLLPSVAVASVLVVAAVSLVSDLSQQAEQRAEDQLPLWDRLNTNAAAERMIAERPLLGFGWDQYSSANVDYLRQGEDYPLTGVGLDVHNVFLARAVELGLVGAAIWLAAFVLAIGSPIVRGPPVFTPWRLGLLAIAVHWVIVANFGPVTYAFPTFLLWLWAGVARAEASEAASLSSMASS
jgi:O-antigen ligase